MQRTAKLHLSHEDRERAIDEMLAEHGGDARAVMHELLIMEGFLVSALAEAGISPDDLEPPPLH